ncbi:MAG: FadR/GntR family transcriptional regulator [Bacilli bacterium]
MKDGKARGFMQTVFSIQNYIREHGVGRGDKLPSERELSDKLGVSRSSVREGLRSLELLGIIESRIGEGTFLRDPSEFQVVEMLGVFFLQRADTLRDLIAVRTLIERAVIEEGAWSPVNPQAIVCEEAHEWHRHTIGVLVDSQPNQLLARIWHVVHGYFSNATIEAATYETLTVGYRAFQHAVSEGDREAMKQQYETIADVYNAYIQSIT